MVRGLTLKRYQIKNAHHNYLSVFRLRVEASDPVGGADTNVFIYRRLPPDPHTGVVYDELLGVCSPVDMVEFPAVAPDTSVSAMFRTSSYEIDLRSSRDYEATWNTTVLQVTTLLHTQDEAEDLIMVEEVEIRGDEQVSYSSESAPFSESI